MVGSAVFMAISTIGQAFGSFKAGEAQQKAAEQAMQDREQARRAQEESNKIASANEKAKLIQAQRQAAREESVRRARILQGAENTGTEGSSGAIGSTGVLGTNFGSVISTSAGREAAVAGINTQNQISSNFLTSANNAITQGNADAAGWGVFSSVAEGARNLAGNPLATKFAGKIDSKYGIDQKAEGLFDSIFS